MIINKEVMQLKAVELGYGEDERVQKAKRQLLEHHARRIYFDDRLDLSGAEISQEEIDAYVERLGERRTCRFVITNFESGAAKAGEAARGGADWDEIVAEYHDASPDPEGKYEITIAWGQYDNNFERDIFAAEVGGVTPPIETAWGYWVTRVENIDVGEQPDLEEAMPRVRTGLEKRRGNRIQQDLEEQIRTKHNFHFDEDVLWIVYKGLPEQQEMMDPETKQPWAQEDLVPLNIAEADRDRVLYSFTTRDGETVVTAGDYKQAFDEMNIFRRPKYSEMLGGLRTKIMKQVNNTMLTDEVIVAGYLEDPRVEELAMNQIYEMMVTNLHGDLVQIDDYVSPEDQAAYWAENKDRFVEEEKRIHQAVVCDSQEAAQKAAAELKAGADFLTVLESYST
ncbi:MAG: peptidyl-prolyl cis-trans isomerase, partial [Hyphomicrobiaceae bacterium]|nr:peptidyl-prolyl cis-trans isomerase [Hyphomicrobiaceae bacterium]